MRNKEFNYFMFLFGPFYLAFKGYFSEALLLFAFWAFLFTAFDTGLTLKFEYLYMTSFCAFWALQIFYGSNLQVILERKKYKDKEI